MTALTCRANSMPRSKPWATRRRRNRQSGLAGRILGESRRASATMSACCWWHALPKKPQLAVCGVMLAHYMWSAVGCQQGVI